MATEYIKIDDGIYEEKIPTKRLELREINAKIDAYIAEKEALIQPPAQEVFEMGKLLHPYYINRERINGEIEALRELKQTLLNIQ